MAVSENSNYTPDKEKTILLLEVARGKVRAKFAGHQGMDYAYMTFSSDGKLLASGGGDTTALSGSNRPDVTADSRRPHLSPKEFRDSWGCAGRRRRGRGIPGHLGFDRRAEQTLPLLREYLRPLPAANPKETARRLADLDGDDFDVREKAEKELREQGKLVEPVLRKALANGRRRKFVSERGLLQRLRFSEFARFSRPRDT